MDWLGFEGGPPPRWKTKMNLFQLGFDIRGLGLLLLCLTRGSVSFLRQLSSTLAMELVSDVGPSWRGGAWPFRDSDSITAHGLLLMRGES